jgi:hypothetical protein
MMICRAEGDAELGRELTHRQPIDADLGDDLAGNPDDLAVR